MLNISKPTCQSVEKNQRLLYAFLGQLLFFHANFFWLIPLTDWARSALPDKYTKFISTRWFLVMPRVFGKYPLENIHSGRLPDMSSFALRNKWMLPYSVIDYTFYQQMGPGLALPFTQCASFEAFIKFYEVNNIAGFVLTSVASRGWDHLCVSVNVKKWNLYGGGKD